MRNPDVFPTRDDLFNNFQDGLLRKVNSKKVPWGFTTTELAVLTDQQKVWVEAWEIASNKDNRTTAQTRAKTNARKDYQKVLRPFIQARIHGNPKMTEADIISCGIKPHKLTRTPVPAPKGTPQLSLVPQGGKQVKVYFNPEKGQDGSSKRAMPNGVVGLQIRFKIGGTPPSAINECLKYHIVTSNPFLFTFEDVKPGVIIYAIACWLGTKGQEGPSCEAQKCRVY